MPHSEALGKEGWLEARVAGCGVPGSELQTGSSQAPALPMAPSAGRCTTLGGEVEGASGTTDPDFPGLPLEA